MPSASFLILCAIHPLLKYRYLEKIKKRKHREKSANRGSSCGDELGLEGTAEPSRKKHKDSGVDGEEIGRWAVAKLRNNI